MFKWPEEDVKLSRKRRAARSLRVVSKGIGGGREGQYEWKETRSVVLWQRGQPGED